MRLLRFAFGAVLAILATAAIYGQPTKPVLTVWHGGDGENEAVDGEVCFALKCSDKIGVQPDCDSCCDKNCRDSSSSILCCQQKCNRDKCNTDSSTNRSLPPLGSTSGTRERVQALQSLQDAFGEGQAMTLALGYSGGDLSTILTSLAIAGERLRRGHPDAAWRAWLMQLITMAMDDPRSPSIRVAGIAALEQVHQVYSARGILALASVAITDPNPDVRARALGAILGGN